MNEKPTISVVVPIYKAEKYLRQCVDSILAQTFRNFELILVDDGSPDGSPGICDEYAAEHTNVHVIHQANGGHSVARRAGVSRAVGEYVLLVDSDDWLEPTMLEVLYNNAKQSNADIVTCNSIFHGDAYRINADQRVPYGVYDKKLLHEDLYPRMLYSGEFFYFGIFAAMWNKLFRRELLIRNLENVDPRVRVGEDGLTTFGCFLDAEHVVVLEDRLYNYRNNNASITRSYVDNQFASAQLLIDGLRRMSRDKNVYDLSRQIDYYLMYNVKSIIKEEFCYGRQRPFVKSYKYIRQICNDLAVQDVAHRVAVPKTKVTTTVFFRLLKLRFSLVITVLSLFYAKALRLKRSLRRIS